MHAIIYSKKWQVIEEVDQQLITMRMKVPGGWIVATHLILETDLLSTCFIADPDYKWEIEEVYGEY